MRNPIKPPLNRITQGTIFSCVKSPYVSGRSCYGISITARCDTARDFKAPSLTFLPLVSMEDWLWYECLPKCIKDQFKAIESGVRAHLVQKFGSSVVLDTFGIDAGFNAADQRDSGIRKQLDRYQQAKSAEKLASYSWVKLPASIANLLESEAGNLLAGRNQNFYFVDSVEPPFGDSNKSIGCGYVAILRDVRTVSRNLALQIAKGIDAEKLMLIAEEDFTSFQLEINKNSFCMPTGELDSPFIEQLMQNFSLLFGRIGTKDVSKTYTAEISKLLGR